MSEVSYSTSSNDSVSFNQHHLYTPPPSSGEPVLSSDWPASRSFPRGLSGERLIGFRDIIKAGGNATTPMTATEEKLVTVTPYSGIHLFPESSAPSLRGARNEVFGDYAFAFAPVDLDSSQGLTVSNMARQQFYSRLSTQTKGLTILGELRETVAMLKNPALGLRRGLEAYYKSANKLRVSLSRGTTSRLKSRIFQRSVAELWLEYSFGWKPLISDIDSVFTSLNEVLKEPQFEHFNASAVLNSNTPFDRYSQFSTAGGDMFIDMFKSTSTETSSRITGTVKNELSASLPAKLGFLPAEFIPAAWELVPWSFAIDYFVNIGQVLDAWATSQRLGFGFVSETQRTLTTTTIRGSVVQSPDITGTDGHAVFTKKLVKRTREVDVPVPSITVRSKLSSSKGLNLAALYTLRNQDINFRRP